MKQIFVYIILVGSLLSNTYFLYETNYLKKHIKYIEAANQQLKESPEIYWQNAMEKFNNKNYEETKEILNKLIEKFPTSSLVEISQKKIEEIILSEKKKKEEEQKIIKSLPKQIADAKNTSYAEKILNDLDKKYDENYCELKDIIKKEREKVREKDAKRIIATLPQKVKKSKSALAAEKMLDDIRDKYGSYPGVQQAIAQEKNKIREKIEREKQKKLENRLGGGYKNLKWGMSVKQVFQILSYKYYDTITNGEIYQFDLKEGNTVYCRFYHNKLYEVLSGITTANSGENNQQNVYKKLLQKFSNEFGEQCKYESKQECHIWEDKYTTITLYTGNTRYRWFNVAVCYQSKNIINQMEKDIVREQEENQNKYNRYIDSQINNL